MSALVLKSTNSLDSSVLPPTYVAYKNRVEGDGGRIVNPYKTVEALEFLSGIGLGSDEAFTVAGASWGIKEDSQGNIIKVYSLLNPKGDLVPSASATSLTRLGISDTHEAIKFTGVSGQELYTKDAFDSAETLTTMFINKPPRIGGDDSSYSNLGSMGMFVIYSPSLLSQNNGAYNYLKDSSETVTGSVLQLESFGNLASGNRLNWSRTIAAYGGVAISTKKTEVFASEGSCYAPTVWTSNTESSQLYNRGSGVLLSSAPGRTVELPDYKAVYGVSPTASKILGNPLYSDVMEIWLVRNGTKEQAKEISTRAIRYDS